MGAAQFWLFSEIQKIHPGTSKVRPLAVKRIEQMALPIMVSWRKCMLDRMALSLKFTPEASPLEVRIIPIPPPDTGSHVGKLDNMDLKTKLLF